MVLPPHQAVPSNKNQALYNIKMRPVLPIKKEPNGSLVYGFLRGQALSLTAFALAAI